MKDTIKINKSPHADSQNVGIMWQLFCIFFLNGWEIWHCIVLGLKHLVLMSCLCQNLSASVFVPTAFFQSCSFRSGSFIHFIQVLDVGLFQVLSKFWLGPFHTPLNITLHARSVLKGSPATACHCYLALKGQKTKLVLFISNDASPPEFHISHTLLHYLPCIPRFNPYRHLISFLKTPK